MTETTTAVDPRKYRATREWLYGGCVNAESFTLGIVKEIAEEVGATDEHMLEVEFHVRGRYYEINFAKEEN